MHYTSWFSHWGRLLVLILLSPAKLLDFKSRSHVSRTTQPQFLDQSAQLVATMREKTTSDLQSMMDVSTDVANLNVERFGAWTGRTTRRNGKQAILAFMGDVYRSFDAQSLSARALAYVQQHVRILSGLYGILRPLDLIEPYRLEMGLSVDSLKEGNLYKFWGNQITQAINEDLGDKQGQVVVNLASDEYSAAVDFSRLNARVVHPKFREWRSGGFKVVSFNAKRARGSMARFLIDQRVNSYRALTGFNRENYSFNRELSKRDRPMFTRMQAPA